MERIENQRIRLFLILVSVIFSAVIPAKVTASEIDADLRKKAESGDGVAQYQLGRTFFTGTAERKANREVAAYWFRKSAAAGNGAGHSAWGYCLEHGIGTAKDPVAAFYEYRKAAEKGVAEAACRYAAMLLTGVSQPDADPLKHPGIVAEPVKAMQILETLIRQGSPSAMRIAGQWELQRENGDRKRGESLLRQAAAGNDFPAMRLLAKMLTQSDSPLQNDPDQAFMLLEKAVAAGDLRAAAELAHFLEVGMGCEPDERRAAELYRAAAEHGIPEACSRYGDFLWSGKGGVQDLRKALELYRTAAADGNARAQYQLGFCHLRGIGVEKDPAKAVDYFFQAARNGDKFARLRLAESYRSGIGIQTDAAAAAYWFSRAAQSGLPEGIREYALCLIRGDGVAKDSARGFALLRHAAACGDEMAIRLMPELQKNNNSNH